MSAILTGPTIKWTDTTALFNLSIQCQSALDIRQSNPTTIHALDDQSTIDALVNRLNEYLRSLWMQHRRLIKPTFQFFADWLEEWADISRINKDTCPSTSVQSQIEMPLPSKGLTNTSSNFNSKRHLQPLKPVQRSSSRGSQKSNPGDREYRDTLEQIHNQTPNHTNYKFQKHQPGRKTKDVSISSSTKRGSISSVDGSEMCMVH